MQTRMNDVRLLIGEIINVDPALIDAQCDRDAIPGWDSLAHLRIVTAIESRYHVRLTMAQIVAARTAAELSRMAGQA